MSYIGDMRKFVGHAPIMAVAAMAILYNEEKGMLMTVIRERILTDRAFRQCLKILKWDM